MNQRDIEMLVRMAVEADSLSATGAASSTREIDHGGGRTRAADGFAARPVGSRSLLGRIGAAWPVAAAAAVLLAGVLRPQANRGGLPGGRGYAEAGLIGYDGISGVGPLRSRVAMCYTPGRHGGGAGRVDYFQPTVAEHAAIIAIFRAWNSDCDCLVWQLHKDDGGASVMDAAPGEPVDIALNVEGAPAVEQMLLLAVSKDRGPLAKVTADEADSLLDCLNGSALAACSADTTACASAVQQCLPSGVTVVPQSFVVQPR